MPACRGCTYAGLASQYKTGGGGDKVCVELGARGMLRATWLAYIFPLVMLFAGVAAGYFLAPENSRDIIAAFAGLGAPGLLIFC